MNTYSLRRVPVLLAALVLPLILILVQFQIVNSYAADSPSDQWGTDTPSVEVFETPYGPTTLNDETVTKNPVPAQHDCNLGAVLVNCGFETGDFTGWITNDLPVPLFSLQVNGAGLSTGFGFFTSQPTEGNWAALHGFDGDGPGVIQVAQDVALPAIASIMQFDYRGAWDLTSFGAIQDRFFQVSIGPFGGGVPTQTITILTATVGTLVTDTGSLTGIVDLSAYAGTPVRLSFDWIVPENYSGPGFFQLDNVWVAQPDVTISKSSQPAGAIEVGDPLTYTIATSAIISDFTGLIMTDTLPAGLILNQVNTSQGMCSGNAVIVCDIGSLSAGSVATVTLSVTTTIPGEVSNVATVSSNEPNDNPANNTVTETRHILSLIPQPGLYGSTVNGEIIYIDVETGAADLFGTVPFQVTEIEFDNVTGRAFVQEANGAFQGDEIDIRTGQIISGPIINNAAYNGIEYVGATAYGTAIIAPAGPSELRTIDPFSGISALVGATGVGPISGLAYDEVNGVLYGVAGGGITTTNFYTLDLNTGVANVFGSTGVVLGGLQFGPDGKLYAGSAGTVAPGNLYEINPNTGAASLIGATGFGSISGLTLVRGTDLALEKSASPEPVLTGQELMYTLVISNIGPMTATNVMVTDTLPMSVTFVSATPSQGSCGEAGGNVTCALGQLGKGSQATVEIIVEADAAGTITNSAVVTANELDYIPNNNEASVVSTVELHIMYLPIVLNE